LRQTLKSDGGSSNAPHALINALPQSTIHVYEVRPRQDKRGVDLISDLAAIPGGCDIEKRSGCSGR
jgi:hypothetical protein